MRSVDDNVASYSSVQINNSTNFDLSASSTQRDSNFQNQFSDGDVGQALGYGTVGMGNLSDHSRIDLSVDPDLLLDSDETEITDELISERTRELENILTAWLPKEIVSSEQIRLLVNRCLEAADLLYGMAHANKWAEGYQFPVGVTDRDWRELEECEFDLTELVRRRQASFKESRFNLDRLHRWPSGSPYAARLDDLVKGMEVCVPPEPHFVPSGRPQVFSKKYLQVKSAVHKMVSDIYGNNGVMLFPTDKLVEKVKDLHFSITSWAPKQAKKCGRLITNPSNVRKGDTPLNSKLAQTMVRERWGQIIHPTLTDLVAMINRLSDQHGRDNLVLWKQDLANAFGLMDVLPESARLSANSLDDNVTLVYIVGFFGWTGTPYAFNVITKALEVEAVKRVKGEVKMYVDDFMGCSHRADVATDMATTHKLACDLLGPKAVAEHKSECSRKLTFIGWDVDLDKGVVFLSERNFMKAFYGFFFLDVEKTIPYSKLESLAAWASRYVTVASFMKPHVMSLHAAKSRVGRNKKATYLSEEAKYDILFWRAFLCIAQLQPDRFARSLDSFRDKEADIKIEFDASLQGVGFVVTDLLSQCVVAMVSQELNYGLTESGFQNAVEFIAVVTALAVCAQFGLQGRVISLVGDSVSALKWSRNNSFRSVNLRRASSAFVMICSWFRFHISETEHVAGVDNILCDDLSRGVYDGSRGAILGAFTTDSPIYRLISLMNPLNPLTSEEQYRVFWGDLRRICQDIPASPGDQIHL